MKTGMLAAGILFEEKEKSGILALMTRLLGHCIRTGKKNIRDISLIKEAGGYHFTRVFLYVSFMGRVFSSRKIDSVSCEDIATPGRGVSDIFSKC